MPFVRVDIHAGKPEPYRRAILAGTRVGIVSALGTEDDRVRLRLVETPGSDIDTTSIHTDRFTVVTVTMLPGRSLELKEAMCEAIAANLATDPGIEASDLIVIIDEPPAEHFFIGGRMQGHAPSRGQEVTS